MRTKWRTRCGSSSLTMVFTLVEVAVANFNSSVKAQIIPDETLSNGSSVVTPDTIKGIESERISGGAVRGSNLFHSFREFNIGEGKGGYFENPAVIENIFSRVTGSNPSEILGTLGVLGNANLFFLNPNGIIFGPNASLDLRGSFVGTTADSIVFPDGKQFSASNPDVPPLLTVNVQQPIGLQFEGQSGIITNAADLAVASRQTLSLSGSDVATTGNLTAPGGRVEVLGTNSVALLEDATIDVSAPTGGGTVLIGGDFQGKGTVPNAKRTYVGDKVTIDADTLTNGNGGKVIVWADEVTGFYGNISARGGVESGHGGLVEVSGKEHLIFRGQVNTSAVNGLPGTLLLDPTNIIIADGSGDEAGDGTDSFAGNNSGVEGSILSAPLSEINDTAPTTIYESELEGLSGDTNIILQATNDITLQDLTDDRLDLAAGAGVIALSADADRDGVGDFVMEDNLADTIFTNGRNIEISSANSILGNIDTSTSSLTNSGSITVNAANGNITARNLHTSSSFADAGTVSLNANGNITMNSRIQTLSSTGNGGDVSLTAGENITLNPFSSILSIGLSSGDITLDGKGDISIERSGIISNNLFKNESNSLTGNITLEANSIFLINGSFLNASTVGQGNSGLIKLVANETISLTGRSPLGGSQISSQVGSVGSGNSEGIVIETKNLFLSDGAEINASTFGVGDAGVISITATDAIALVDSGGIFSQVGSIGEGTAEGITIETGSLSLSDGAQLDASTFGVGDAGAITITTTDAITLEGEDSQGFRSGIFSSVQPEAEGSSRGITIDTGSLSLKDGAVVSTNTFGLGNAGSISITATDAITLEGETRPGFGSAIGSQVRPGAQGTAGVITITTGSLSLTDGAEVSANTEGEGEAGNIVITAKTLEATSGSQIETNTTNNFDAADIILEISDNLFLSGTDSGLFANTQEKSSGNGGSITIDPNTVIIRDGAQIAVNSNGSGVGGDINLQAGSLTLDRGTITAETASNQGGNINLTLSDLLTLRNNSEITASAGTAQEGGDGGNIKIDAPFIIAFPQENSDITANAFEGDGGNITINANGIFGIESRDEETPLSDITASSEFGQQGEVEINTSAIDPTRSLNNLPQEAISAEVAQGCQTVGGKSTLEFFDIGRGGLPPSPDDLFSSEIVIAEWIPLDLADDKVREQTLEGSFTEDEIKNMTLLTTFPCQSK